MKLHISQDQLSELSEEGFEKLILWVTKITVPAYSSFDGMMVSNPDLRKKGLLSIGQMIEFLGEHLMITRFANGKYLNAWRVGYLKSPIMSFTNYKENIVLCDALWSAVKEVLEK